jgi:hypothetical protein
VRTGDRVLINPALDCGKDPRAQGPRFRILGLRDNGTVAEFVKVPAASVFPRPAHLFDEGAAALPLAGLTPYRAVLTRGRVQRPDQRSLGLPRVPWAGYKKFQWEVVDESACANSCLAERRYGGVPDDELPTVLPPRYRCVNKRGLPHN